MKLHTIKAFTNDRGENVIKKWLGDLPIEVEVAIVQRLRYLETQNVWGRPYSDKVKGHIHKVMVQCQGNKYRPLGYFGPKPRDFTLLTGASEKNSKLIPEGCLKIAEKRRQLVEKDGKYAREYFR